MRDLQGKVALITGGSRGIGLATAVAFAQAGATVALASRTDADLAVARGAVEDAGAQVLCVPTDVTKPHEVRRLFESVLSEYHRLDVLVNGAGASLRRSADETTDEEWDFVIDTNLRSTFLCTRAALQLFYEQRSGCVINIASTSAKKGYAGSSAYCAAKFGVLGFTEAVEAEARAFGIRVSAVCPGPTNTHLRRTEHPEEDHDALIQPSDVARAICFLVTQEPTAYIPEITVKVSA